MSASASICFKAGPFRGWWLFIDRYRAPEPDGRMKVFVQLTTSTRTGGLSGVGAFSEGSPGYDAMQPPLRERGREPFERALCWLLDAAAERLAERPDEVTPEARDHWQRIVDAGRAARDEYAARYGDGPEPALEVVWAGTVAA